MSEAPAEAKRVGGPLGCLLPLVIVVALLAGVVTAIGLIFDQGDSAEQPLRGFDAGPADAYQRADLVFHDADHAYVVRLDDGSFIALYDKSSRQQELKGDCRIMYDETALLGALQQLPGFKGAFVEDCEDNRTVWRVDGQFAFGGGYGDMDRFDTQVNGDGRLIVKTKTRSCTRSAGVAGVPPYRPARCSGND